MNPYIQKLKVFLAEQAPNFKYDDTDSIMEMLCYYYCSAHPVDNAAIRCQLGELGNIMRPMSLEESDALFSLVGNLCLSYERQAFLNGVSVGICLFNELSTLTDN